MTKSLAIAAGTMWAVMALLDFLWLSTATRLLYRPKLGPLLNETPVWPPAILFYLLYGVGVLVFVVRPALGEAGSGSSILQAMLLGALFGLVAYGTYDLTNHATIPNWPLSITVIDMAWGALLTALTTGAAVWAGQKFG
jgi:uncharacterized membrane protein